ncbi:dipeptide ABC transporter ATP-binding protein [Promicromonospora sp. NPDC057488]|uniref:dipeptide ABC transporter ATP-binding protein n=1 Tax=Promicromonospora sp. NPDC057488 TaxID=3346147 RepID=UPI00366CA905
MSHPTADADTPVLRLTALDVAYQTPQETVHALRGLDLTLHAGESVAIVGESGSGKTTAALAAVGLLPPNADVTGDVALAGESVVGLTYRQWRRHRGRTVGLVPQDPTVSLDPVLTIGAQVAEILTIHRLAPRHALRREVVELLDRVGIDRPAVRYGQYPHELSGGMRQRVLIAMALAAKPRLIVADEPTSGLDVTVQRTVLDLLEDVTRETGTALLLITHDLGVALDRTERVVVMSRGEVVERGQTRQVLRTPEHPYTRALIAAAPSLESAARGRARPAGSATVEDAAGPGIGPGTDGAPPPLLRLDEVSRVFHVRAADGARDTVTAVDGIDLAVDAGRTLAIVGESGSGKTTTARIVVGLDRPTSGTVTFDGHDLAAVRGRTRRALRREVQFVHQNPYASLDPRFTVLDLVEQPLRAFHVGDRASRRRTAHELLDQVALPAEVAARTPARLSGGQRQRVAIARALALRPRLVVLDEPVSALDVSVQRQVLDLLRRLQDELALTYVFVSHDLAVVRSVADDVAVMRAGRVLERGPVADVFESPQHPYTVELLDAIPGRRYADLT